MWRFAITRGCSGWRPRAIRRTHGIAPLSPHFAAFAASARRRIGDDSNCPWAVNPIRNKNERLSSFGDQSEMHRGGTSSSSYIQRPRRRMDTSARRWRAIGRPPPQKPLPRLPGDGGTASLAVNPPSFTSPQRLGISKTVRRTNGGSFITQSAAASSFATLSYLSVPCIIPRSLVRCRPIRSRSTGAASFALSRPRGCGNCEAGRYRAAGVDERRLDV